MKIFKSTLVLLLLAGVFSLTTNAQNTKRVLMEEFTNASCGPCASQNPAFQALLDANEAKVVGIKWQTEFPGFDPMNTNNAAEINARTAYYPGISGVPTTVMNGLIPGDAYGGGIGEWDVAGGGYEGGPYGYNTAVIDNENALTTPLSMVLTHDIDDDLTMVGVSLEITNDGAADFSLASGKVHIVLLEKEIVFPSAPGSNGETEFFDIAIKMLTGMDGQALPTLAPGETHTVTLSEAIPGHTYDKRELRVAAFVQDDGDKAVYQSTITDPEVLTVPFTDLSLTSSTATPTELCNVMITPTVSVTNNADLDVTEFNVSYTIDGGTPVVENWTGTLAMGASEMVTFPEITLAGGTTNIDYSVEAVGLPDVASINNSAPTESYSSASDTPIGNGYSEDNETYDAFTYPTIGLVEEPIAAGEFGWGSFNVIDQTQFEAAMNPIGGYALSEKSIWVNFYQWNPAEANAANTGSLTYDKIDLTGANGATLAFDRASAEYTGGSTDALDVSISSDCGDTWTSVWSKGGGDLSTVPPVEELYFPAADDWTTEVIDLSNYDGTSEVLVRFQATSGWGNSLFLDNIYLYSAVGNLNLDLLEGIEVKVTPNPVVETATINIELEASLNMDVAIYDLSGRLVRSLSQGQDFVAGTSTIEWDVRSNEGAAVANGLYMVRITSEKGQITTKLMVAK